jgi:hypothetical protein
VRGPIATGKPFQALLCGAVVFHKKGSRADRP